MSLAFWLVDKPLGSTTKRNRFLVGPRLYCILGFARPGDSLGFPSAVDLNFRWKRVQRKVGNSVEITRARRRPTGREVRESEICFHTDGDPDASIACQSAVNEVPSLDYYEMSNVK